MVEGTHQNPAASCHSDAAGPVATAGAPVVALVGAPNVGKTTLFNSLTGSRRETGNWPGTSVVIGHGSRQLGDREVAVVDLPGTYSLDPLSPGEALTRALLVEVPEAERPDLTVVVLDATALARSLYLLAQIRELPGRVIAVVTMTDIAAGRGVRVHADRLGAATGIPVLVLDPRRRDDVDAFAALAGKALDATAPPAQHHGDAATTAGRTDGSGHPGDPSDPDNPGVLDDPGHPDDPGYPDALAALDRVDDLDAADARFAWVDRVVTAGQERLGDRRLTRSDRIDRLVASPFGGTAVFLAAMWLLFQLTTTIAAPVQGWLSGLLGGPVVAGVTWLLDLVGLGGSTVARFVVRGLVPGVGMVLTFVPVMTLMFAALSVLEDSGYMARAAVLTDRLMRMLRLPGRAFLPLVVGFGCNVPAVLGTRVLPSARHRLLTALLVPFTSCSARLTVYVLVAGMFFPEHAGSVVFTMYLVSILFVVVFGLALRSTVLRDLAVEPLMIDLPPYHLPMPRLVLHSTWVRVRGFLSTAGGLIVGTVALVWVLQAIPVRSGDGSFGEIPVERSVYAASARMIAPVFDPAGFGDWHTSSALMTGFVAKEAVISTWAQTYSAQRIGSGSGSGAPVAVTTPVRVDPEALGTDVRAHFSQASGGHPEAAAWAFLVFLLAYTPCVATLAAQRREIGLRWTAFGMATQLGTAWLVAVAVFQIGRLLT